MIEEILPRDQQDVGEAALSQTIKDQWLRDGYVVLRGVYDADRIARYNEVVRQERLTVEESKDAYGYGERIGLLHQKYPELLELATGNRVLDVLRFAFGEEPIVFASLNFEKGTEQAAHVDAIFFYPQPAYAMAGCWVALEDIRADAGPLFYVPGSHRWPFSNGEDVAAGRAELAARREAVRQTAESPEQGDVVRDLANTWTSDFVAMQAAKGVEQAPLLPKAGDVVIWHSLLAHGGSARVDPRLSRRSVVFHYIGANSKLYTHEQFFLKNREELKDAPPQSVPLASYKGLRYMKYGHYVSYKDGEAKIHLLG